MTTLIMADDHPVVLEGLKALLNPYPDYQIIATASNGQLLLQAMVKAPADVVLVDINMPVMDGLEATQKLKDAYPATRVIVMTMHADADHAKKMTKAGADGYLLKTTDSAELHTAIQQVLGGSPYYDARVTQNLLNSVSGHRPEPSIRLTRREKEVLRELEKGLSTPQIAEKLFISRHTVESHRKNLLSKFNVNNTVSLINAAQHQGFL